MKSTMTLLETINQEIEKIGGVKSAYYTIKSENSNLYKDQLRARIYFAHKIDGSRVHNNWRDEELSLINSTLNENIHHVVPLLPQRTYNSIVSARTNMRRNINFIKSMLY